MVVKDASEKPAAPRASDPGELLDLVRTAEEEARIAARDRPSDPGVTETPVSSRDIVAVDPDRPSGEVFEVGDEVLEVPTSARSPGRRHAATETPGKSWPPLATVPLLIAIALAALAVMAR